MVKTTVESYLQFDSRFFYLIEGVNYLGYRDIYRLFAEYVLSRSCRGNGQFRMGIGGTTNNDGLDFRIIQQVRGFPGYNTGTQAPRPCLLFRVQNNIRYPFQPGPGNKPGDVTGMDFSNPSRADNANFQLIFHKLNSSLCEICKLSLLQSPVSANLWPGGQAPGKPVKTPVFPKFKKTVPKNEVLEQIDCKRF
jgi:hypothetical protein